MCYSRASDRSNSGQRDILKPSEMLWSLVATAKWHSKVAKSWHLPQAEGFKKDLKQLGRDIFFISCTAFTQIMESRLPPWVLKAGVGFAEMDGLDDTTHYKLHMRILAKDTTPVNWSHQVSDPFGKVQVMGVTITSNCGLCLQRSPEAAVASLGAVAVLALLRQYQSKASGRISKLEWPNPWLVPQLVGSSR